MRPTATARSGFTLIELLLVIGIILLLAGLVVPQFIGQQQQAQIDTTRIAVHSFEQALDIYRMNAGAYPTTEQGLAALLAPPTSEPIPQKWVGPYLKEGSTLQDPWQNVYQYAYPGTYNQTKPDIWSAGPDRQSGTADDIGNWLQQPAR